MERLVVIGTKQKLLLGIDENSLGGMSLSEVDFSVKFFAKERRDSLVTGIYVVQKSSSTPAGDGAYFLVCDTSELDTGNLCGILEATYQDSDTGLPIVDKTPLTTDIRLVADAKVYGKYDEAERLLVAGRVYAVDGDIDSLVADTSAYPVTFSDGGSLLSAYAVAIRKSSGEAYFLNPRYPKEDPVTGGTTFITKWQECSTAMLASMTGEYLVDVKASGGDIYLYDGETFERKGYLWKLKN